MASTTNDSLISLSQVEEEYAISSFQKLLQFPTVSSIAADSGAYVDCANYILQELNSLQVLSDIHILPDSPHHSPIVVAQYLG